MTCAAFIRLAVAVVCTANAYIDWDEEICLKEVPPTVGMCLWKPCMEDLGPTQCVNSGCYCKRGYCRVTVEVDDLLRWCAHRIVDRTCDPEIEEAAAHKQCGDLGICYGGLCHCRPFYDYDATAGICKKAPPLNNSNQIYGVESFHKDGAVLASQPSGVMSCQVWIALASLATVAIAVIFSLRHWRHKASTSGDYKLLSSESSPPRSSADFACRHAS
eukprot:gnl/TRDRNA2_/TRDRNA2_197759_c0_seq1.p1 gnl/TRDRNA2_/TRDRNA2_197759_c0~~gnl/TRDRNA2_/TRDRNA2_197759_c0_seq1.p1  ORF type:complete len:217 (-),score=18.47 gnl/TRDRNA2_/TRDRNA2_197759_c0_seq1:71-721(-)